MARRRFYVIAGLCLPLYLWAFLNQFNLPVLPSDLDLASITYPATVQGIGAGTETELLFIVEGWNPGDPVQIMTADGVSLRVQLVPADNLFYWVTAFCSGIFFWLIAAFVLAPRCDRPAVRYFFWMTILYGLGIELGGVYFNTDPWSARTVFSLMQLGVLAFLPPVFIGLAQTFPRILFHGRQRRDLMRVLWLLATALTVWQFVVYQRYFMNPGPELGARLVLPVQVADGLMILQALAGIVLMIVQLRGAELTRERHQAQWVLVGFVIGAAPYVFVRNLMLLLGYDAPLHHSVDRIFELAIPIGFGMAIARYRFLNIDIIIRRGLIYGLLAGVMTGLLLLVGYGVGLALPNLDGPLQWVQLIMTGVMGGLFFPYLRRGIGGWVDRTFFRITYDHERALVQLRRHLEQATDGEALVRRLFAQVSRTVAPGILGVVVGTGEDQRVAGDQDPYQIRRWWDIWQAADLPLGLMGSPGSTSLPEFEKSVFPPALREDGIVMVQTIEQGDVAIGAIMCGPRDTGRRYVQKDMLLLEAFALEVEEALARISLVTVAANEGLERQRLDQLNSLKNEFLAQVAHDLRTPLSSVTWTAANLYDGLAGELNEGQARYVESITSSAAHLNRLVDNLIEISHLDSGEIRFEPCKLDLDAVVAEAIRTIAPVAEAKEVSLSVNSSPVQAFANPDKLAVVLVNLLDNAVKYSPPGGQVEVTVGQDSSGQALFCIRDHGPGFGEAENLFRRFTQGEPSPYSQQRGFGLGLFIVKSYLDRLGGNISAADHPDGGAEVICTLPVPAS